MKRGFVLTIGLIGLLLSIVSLKITLATNSSLIEYNLFDAHTQTQEIFNNQKFAEQNRVHNATNYETLKIIDNEVWLKVIVRLKDESGTLPEQVDERIEWFEPVIDEVLVTLNEREFKDIRRHSDGFSGLISKEGFDKLVQDERVWEINWPRTGFRAALDDSAPLINANDAWDILGYTGEGIKVCVIDSGVDADHPDLSGKIIAEKCYCDDNCCPGGGTITNNATDDNGHGTHVAGIIASQDPTYKGIAYDSDVYVTKVQ